MRNPIIPFTIFIIVALGIFGYIYMKRPNNVSPAHPTPTVAVSPTAVSQFCTPQDLHAEVNLSAGAGNIYGTFTLKNISNTSCDIAGGNFINVNYDTNTVKNIIVKHEGQTQSNPFTISPGATLYSQVHYPNGPQCQEATKETGVTFSYAISPDKTVSFANQGNLPLTIQTCSVDTEMTEVQIWQMSSQPITQ